MLGKQELKSKGLSSLDDGLLDIFIGIYIIFAAVSIWSELFWLIGILVPILIPVYQVARNRNKNDQSTTTKKPVDASINLQKPYIISLYLGLLFLFGVALLAIFAGLIPIDSSLFREYIFLILGFVFGTTWIGFGIVSRIRRYYLNGLITIIIFIALQWTKLPFWSALILLGCWTGMLGFVALVKTHNQ